MEGAESKETLRQERRKANRVIEGLDVDAVLHSGVNAGDQIRGQIINISNLGAAIIFNKPVAKGTSISLTIYSEADESTCSGDVIWGKELAGRIVTGVRILRWGYLDPFLSHIIKSQIK